VLSTSLQAIEQALAQIRTADAQENLLLSCSPSFAMSWLTPRLGDFYRRLPEVGLQVMAEFHPLDARRMHTDGLTAALRYDLGHYPDLSAHEVLDEVLLPVASPLFLAEHPQILSPADIDGAWLLHDEAPWAGARPGEEWLHWLTHAGVALPADGLQQGRVFNLSLLAVGAAVAHQGLAMGRLSMVLDDLLAGRLVLPFPSYVRSRASYHLVCAASPPPSVALVQGWLLEQAAGFRARRDEFLKPLTSLG
jgi:DNA-binding transcriptional LysR family regulator